jgi:hypothetical protein
MSRSVWMVGVLVLLALLAIPATPLLAQDASAPPSGKRPTTLEVDFQRSKGKSIPHYLTARLTTEDGSAVAGERIKFVRTADIFGGRNVELGRASTDNAGIARIAVVPREPTYKLTVSFSGNEVLEASEVTKEIAFPEEIVVRTARPPHGGGLVDPHLSPLANVMPGAIGTAVLILWVALLTIGLGTIRKTRVEARKAGRQASDTSAGTPDNKPAST